LSAAREAGRPWEPAPAAEARTANEEQLATGIQTNMCCETTARVGANLGFELGFAIDATHTFDLPGRDGRTTTADELARVTAANLDPEFGRVLTTSEAIGELRGSA
jgi:nicotinamidase-related amidase